MEFLLTEAKAKYGDSLTWPPDLILNSFGSKASHWPNNQMPLSAEEAIFHAKKMQKDLWHSVEQRWIYRKEPLYVNGSGPEVYAGQPQIIAPGIQDNVNSWVKDNWKWALPVAIGAAFLITRR
ncbi:MAG: hypothetical protein ABW148_18730 [Sedimenticola sp.]